MTKFFLTTVLLILANTTEATHKIPLEILFGNPKQRNLKISPGGHYISYLAPFKGVLNLWVKSVHDDDARVITNDTGRGIHQYVWTFDEEALLYLYDANGRENHHLHKVSLKTGADTDLTPFDNTAVHIVQYSRRVPDRMLIAMNKERKHLFDVYELNLNTGSIIPIEQNPGDIMYFIADDQLAICGAMRALPDGGQTLLMRDNNQSAWHPYITWTLDDEHSGPLCLHNEFLYMLDSSQANTTQFVKINMKTNERTILASDPEYDIADVVFHPETHEPVAIVTVKEKEEIRFVDASFAQDAQIIDAALKGPWIINSATLKLDIWLIAAYSDVSTASYYLYDRASKKLTFLCASRPELAQYQLQPMKPITFTARDGLTIHGYLTLPRSEHNKPVPLILLVHGGPWLRDGWDFDPEVQFLANRGYAVLQVNFRGSDGYGKAFLNAGNHEWGRNMHNDLIDAVAWSIKTGVADPKHIAIMGGSYGGYSALAGVTFTPDTFCCAVDLFGICNLITLIKNSPPYWHLALIKFAKRVGDIHTQEALLKERSPLFYATNIKVPVLYAQGLNDIRCTPLETKQMIAEHQKHQIPYEYYEFENEGHGLAKPENKFRLYAAIETFLAKYLAPQPAA